MLLQQAPVAAIFPTARPAVRLILATGRTWPHQENGKNKWDENSNINETTLNAMKILFQADHGHVVIINESVAIEIWVPHNRFLGTQEEYNFQCFCICAVLCD